MASLVRGDSVVADLATPRGRVSNLFYEARCVLVVAFSEVPGDNQAAPAVERDEAVGVTHRHRVTVHDALLLLVNERLDFIQFEMRSLHAAHPAPQQIGAALVQMGEKRQDGLLLDADDVGGGTDRSCLRRVAEQRASPCRAADTCWRWIDAFRSLS